MDAFLAEGRMGNRAAFLFLDPEVLRMEHNFLDAQAMSSERGKDLLIHGERMRRSNRMRKRRIGTLGLWLGTALISLGMKMTGDLELDV